MVAPGRRIFLRGVFASVVLLLAGNTMAQVSREADSSAELPIRTAAEIRHLAPEEAAAEHPVNIRGVVTLVDPGRTIFIQDHTGGTFSKLEKGVSPDIASGHEVTIDGVTFPGLYVPGIEPRSIQIVGSGKLPSPRPVTMEELSSGQHNYEWVQVRGIVRTVSSDIERTVLLLALGSDRLEVHVLGAIDLGHLVDASVLVRGLAAGFINDKRQLVSPHIRIRDVSDIVVEEPALASPFDQAAVPASHLLRFSPAQRPGHRVKVTGVATLQDQGRAIYLRDGEQGLYVETSDPTEVQPGEVVEAVGFPEMGRFSAHLQNASFRIIGRAPHSPEPVTSDIRELLSGARDGNLVSLQAQVVRVLASPEETDLLMQSGDTVFRARGLFPEPEMALTRVGSILRLSGVCRVAEAEYQSAGFRSRPSSFEILLRSAGDIALVSPAPWWNAQRLSIAAGALFAATIVALGWAALLRHQVRRQTALLRNKMETEIVLEERQRLAREFHDTLEQELVGLSLRLDALATRVFEPKPRELLDGTRKLLQRLQTEARALVWDLRERAAIRGNIGEAIQQATSSVGEDVKIEIDAPDDASSLPELTQHHLVRISQEAVTNAVKHGKATAVKIDLNLTPEEIRLEISDNGVGFKSDGDLNPRPGHFGLVGMRERARKIGGEMNVEGTSGKGVTVMITAARATVESTALLKGQSLD